MHKCRICINQEDELSGSEVSLECAMTLRILSGRRVIIPNRESCLMWMLAVANKDPAMKKMKGSGVFLCNFIRFCRQFF